MKSAILTGIAAACIATPIVFVTLSLCGASVGATLLLTPAAAFLAFAFVSATEIDLERRRAADEANCSRRLASLREWTLSEIELDGRR